MVGRQHNAPDESPSRYSTDFDVRHDFLAETLPQSHGVWPGKRTVVTLVWLSKIPMRHRRTLTSIATAKQIMIAISATRISDLLPGSFDRIHPTQTITVNKPTSRTMVSVSLISSLGASFALPCRSGGSATFPAPTRQAGSQSPFHLH